MSSSSTYYVDINSSYRNLEKFQNPADFAVTFQLFTGTGYYPEGVPLTPLTGTSFFTPVSIDPDFHDNDLQAFGLTITDIVREGTETYICGITNFEGLVGFTYKGTVIYSTDGIIAIEQKYGIIAKLRATYVNTTLSGYVVEWVNYLYSEVLQTSEVQDVSMEFEQTGNIFINANLNFSIFGVYTHKPLTPGLNIYALLTNLSTTLSLGQTFNFTYYLSADGFLADYAGHNWGNHIISSEYSLGRFTVGTLTNGYAKSKCILDPSSNIYISNNIDTYAPIYNKIQIPTSSTNLFRKATSPYGSTVYNNQFITCSYTLEVDPEAYSLSIPYTGAGFHYTSINPSSYNYIAFDPVTYSVDPSNVNGQYWTSVCFQECNSNLYAIAGYANIYLSPSPSMCPFYVLLLDTNAHTHTIQAISPTLNTAVLPGCITAGNNIFVGCRYTTGAGSEVRVYDYNATFNTLTLSATLTNAIDPQAYGSYFYGYSDGTNYYFFEFPSCYISEAYNVPLPSQETFTYRVYQYNPIGPTLTQIATGTTFQDFRNASFQSISGITYIYINYFNLLSVSVLDITNPSAIVAVTTLTGKTTQTSNIIPFQITYEGSTHDCVLLALGGYQIYIMDNPYQPQVMFGQNLPLGLSLQLYYNDYFYGCDPLQLIYQLKQRFLPSVITSSHTNINYQVSYPIPIGAASFGKFQTSLGSFVILANTSDIEIWNVSSINNSSFITSASTIGFESIPKQTYCCVVENTVWAFFTCSTRSYVYTVDLTTFNVTYYSVIEDPLFISSLVQVEGYVQNGIQFILLLVDYIDVYPATIFKYTLDNTNGLTYISYISIGQNVLIDLPGKVSVAMKPLLWGPTQEQLVAVFIRDPYISANDGASAYLFMVDSNTSSTLSVISYYYDVGYPSYPQSFEVNTVYSDGDYKIALTVYNSPLSAQLPRYYQLILQSYYLGPEVQYYVGYDAYTFEPGRQRCALATVPFLDGYYIYKAGGYTGTSESYLQISSYNISSNYSFSSNSIALGAYVNEIYVSNFSSKLTCVMLLTDGTLYLYDVTNPQYADQNQYPTLVSETYAVPPSFNSSFLHKINQDGSPDWCTYFGTQFDAGLLGQQISNTSLCADFSTNTISVAGTWNACFQVFEETSTGSYVAKNKLTFNDPYQTNSFRVATEIVTGRTKYIMPYVGQQNVTITDIAFHTYTNSYILTAVATNNFNIYEPQLPAQYMNPIQIQKTLYTTSNSSSFVFSENRDGMFLWNSTLYTLDSQKDISLLAIALTSDRITVVGAMNCSTLLVKDSTEADKQSLYSQAPEGTLSITSAIIYSFGSTGVYLSSQVFELDNITSDIWRYAVKLYPTANQMVVLPNWNAILEGTVDYHNKDGTVGKTDALQVLLDQNYIVSPVVNYKYNSTFVDANQTEYSIVVFDQLSAYPWTGGAFDNYSLGIYNPYNVPILNRDFIVRTNYGDDTLVLNEVIDVSMLDRRFVSINEIAGTDTHWAGNLSKSPLYNVLSYVIGPGGNEITVTLFNPTTKIDTTLYLTFPRDNGMGGYEVQIVPILGATGTGITGQYIFTISSLSELESPVGGALYGPYLYLNSFNESLYYNLQFYPGSIKSPVYFNVQLVSLLIPNRPLLNLRKYGGQRNLKDMPYIYLQIYNEDDEGAYDASILNVAYDNSPLRAKPIAQFKLAIPPYKSTANFVNLVSTNMPLVKFSPGFYNIRLRLLDFNQKVLQWDPSTTKPDDATFNGGIVPEYLTNVYYRLAFTKV
jgi:hypothetical protein